MHRNIPKHHFIAVLRGTEWLRRFKIPSFDSTTSNLPAPGNISQSTPVTGYEKDYSFRIANYVFFLVRRCHFTLCNAFKSGGGPFLGYAGFTWHQIEQGIILSVESPAGTQCR